MTFIESHKGSIVNTGIINEDNIGKNTVMITVPTDWKFKVGENIEQLLWISYVVPSFKKKKAMFVREEDIVAALRTLLKKSG